MSTPTTQQRIEAVAQKHGLRIDGEHPSHAAEDFTYGANFVLDTILPEFAEWLDSGPYVYFDTHKKWKDVNSDESFTTLQIIELFKNRDNG
jgi:hypothetical protein